MRTHSQVCVSEFQSMPPLFKLTAAAGVGLLMCIVLGVSEMRWKGSDQQLRPVWLVITLLVLCLLAFCYAYFVGSTNAKWGEHPYVAISVVLASGLLIGVRSLLDWAELTIGDNSASGTAWYRGGSGSGDISKLRAGLKLLAGSRSKWLVTIVGCACLATLATPLYIGGAGLPGVRLPHQQATHFGFNAVLSITPYLGSLLCLVVLFFEGRWGEGPNRRRPWRCWQRRG